MPHRLSEIQSTPPQGHPAHTSALEPILVVTMPGVAETFKSVINEIKYGTEFKRIDLSHTENGNLTHDYLNSGID